MEKQKMDRRDFLKVACALPVAAVVPPVAAQPAGITVADIRHAVNLMTNTPQTGWYCVVGAGMEQDLRELLARQQWKNAYRRYRSSGLREPLSPAEILAKYPEPVMTGALGRFEGATLWTL